MIHKGRIMRLYHDGWGPQKIYKCLRHRLGYSITLDTVRNIIYGESK